jgi:NAD-dependent DNA ligase
METISVSARVADSRRRSVEIAELVGVCKGVLADGVVNLSEAFFILEWLDMRPAVQKLWPADVLYESLSAALEDGRLSEQQELELLELLVGITGVNVTIQYSDGLEDKVGTSARLPVDEGVDVRFDGRSFCLTGVFSEWRRAECESRVIESGGFVQKTPTKKTDYLVVGAVGSSQWAQSSFGRKIEKAVALRDSGVDIFIISEEAWKAAL